MYFVNVNGREWITAHDKTLITFLRDELNLTGTKDAVNADWVLVDDVKTSARSLRIRDLHGREVVTIEGIPEQEVLKISASLGDLDSGFFAPGMVISAIETAKNGYKKTASADLEKLCGRKQFADDVNIRKQVYVRPVFAKYPGAKITKIDMSRALENDRFGDCILKADVPGQIDGMIGVGDTVRSTDDVVALVVSTYLAEMPVLCRLIDIEYDAVTEAEVRPETDMPECATVRYRDDDTLTVYTNGDDPEKIRALCARALDISADQIDCVSTPVEHAPSGRAEVFAALVAWLTQQSAKIKY